MKKNLIALAVSAAVMSPVAMAEDVAVYGRAQVEIASFDYDNSTTDAANGGISVVDNAMGRVGVKASEDLGNGLSGLAKFEFKLDTADGDSDTACKNDACTSTAGISLTKRELLVGLKGGFGQVELGRLKSAYKYTGGVKYDPFVATTLEARNNGAMSGGEWGHSSFNSDMLGYRSPKLGPFKAEVTYGPEEDDGAYTVSFAFDWKMGGFFLAAADQGDRKKPAEYSAVKLGGQLRFAGGNHKVSMQYEVIDDDTTTAGDPFFWFLGYHGKIGKTELVAQTGFYDPDVTAVGNSSEATYFALGAIFKFSKQTRVFGGYRMTDIDDNTGNSVISVGMRKDF